MPDRRRLFVIAAVVTLLAGCAPSSQLSTAPTASPTSTAGSQAPTGGPTSSAPTTTLPVPQPSGRPSGPPKTPTDQLPTDIVAGTVMADSSGPCYAVQTDDGVLYALAGTGWTVHKGDVVRVKTTSSPAGATCAPGRRAGIVSLTKVQ